MKQLYISLILAASLGLTACDAAFDQNSKRGGSEAVPSGVDVISVENTAPAATGDAASAVKPLGYLLDVNDATKEQLMRVPGLTPDIHRLIENTRPFLDMVEFDDEIDYLDVSASDREELYKYLFMVIDINNGEMEDLRFVPGLSKADAYKITSNRPYQSHAELKKVIEKFAEPKEAERLLAYFKVKKLAK